MSPLSRREFVAAGVAAGAGLVIGFYLPHRAAREQGSLLAQRISAHHARQQSHDRGRALGDGTRRAHGAAHDSRRRTRGGLEADRNRASRRQHAVRRSDHGRQREHPHYVGSDAQGRSRRARDADFRRGLDVERSAICVHGREQPHQARGDQPESELWRTGEQSCDAADSHRRASEAEQGLQDCRAAPGARSTRPPK